MESDERERARQRWIVFGLTVAVAATRIMALSRSMWDWDESLFCMALRHFDVGAHHPHPPGFPLYVALGKLMRLMIPDDFRALRTVQFIAAIFLFPSFYAIARAMRFTFTLAVSAALLFVFLPNVWFYGGTAWSDILSIALFLAGAAFLFMERDPSPGAARHPLPAARGEGQQASCAPSPRGSGEKVAEGRMRGTTLYLLGTALFSLSLLVRPQNVLMAFPWFLATWPRLRARRFGVIAAAALLSIAIVVIGYGAAAASTGPGTWWQSVRAHQNYVSHVDGFLNPHREPLTDVFVEFVIDPFEGGAGPRLLFALAVAALFRPRRRDFEALATFAPFLVLALLMLNTTGTSRLSIGFLPLTVLLAVDGMAFIGGTFARVLRSPRLEPAVVIVIALVLGIRFITWASPALRVVRHDPSPPVQAIEWIRANIPRGTTIYAGGAMPPIAEYYLPDYDLRFVDDDQAAMKEPARNAWYVGEAPTANANAVHFTRPRKKLWALFTRRYFEIDVHPLSGTLRYLSGWYDEEQNNSGGAWRWMGRDGLVALQPLPQGGELRFTAMFPIDHEPPPQVTVSVDGAVLDSFVPAQAFVTRRYELPPSAKGHEVAFHVSNTVNLQRMHLNNDGRDLGMQLDAISWRP